MPASLRLRIAAVITGIVLVAVIGLGVAVHLLIQADRVHQARSVADSQLRSAMSIYRQTGLLSYDARIDDDSVPARLRGALGRDGSRATLVEGGSTRTIEAAGRVGEKVLSTRTRITVADASTRAVDRSLVLAGVVTVVLAILVGLLSAGGLARRLRLAARTARAVSGGEEPTSMRAAVGGRRDEVGDLADAVDAMADRLNRRLRAEQRFTADVAHDLRTPVTGLVTAAALLDDSRPAQMVRDRAAALTTLVEDLLEVARLDRGHETADLEKVDLAEVVTRAIRRGVASGEYAEDQVVVRTDPRGVELLTDRRRLERVLSNLVRNALRHGSPTGAPPVEVIQIQAEITVRDHGPGFDAALLADGPQRFRRTDRSGGGNGLGLVIAEGQTRLLGGALRLGNAESGGAVVMLALPTDRPLEPTSRTGHDRVTSS